jgi:thiopeptide-type bacteriocin biosynthesis protein
VPADVRPALRQYPNNPASKGAQVTSTAAYQWCGAAMLRATTDPGGLAVPASLDIPGVDVSATTAWMSEVWQQDHVRAAISAASPDLSRQLDAVTGGTEHDGLAVRRAATSLASYLIRWRHRSTPFALFAGVAPVRIGSQARARFGDRHRIAVRADTAWLADVTARLERCPALIERLTVVANRAGTVRGGRFVIPGPARDVNAATLYEQLAPIEASVRCTGPVRAALDAAADPVAFTDLRKILLNDFPAATPDQIDGLLSGLIAQNFIIHDLRAPMTCIDVLGCLCARLEQVSAHDIPEISGLVGELHVIREQLATQTQPADLEPIDPVGRMLAVSGAAAFPLVVDTVLDCEVEIPQAVAQEAADAVGVLCRLSPLPFGHPAWRDYHSRFRARYGTGALVPVLELVADSGLGLPADFVGSPSAAPARRLAARDEKLLALVQRATADGSGEIELTPAVIEHLAAAETADMLPAPHLEIAVQVRAASVQALNAGRFRLEVTGTPRPGSSMAGRFAHLLSADDQDLLADAYAAAAPGTIAAQLSFAPRRARNENVVRTARLLPDVIGIAEHYHGPGQIGLDDLAVTADARRFYLVRRSTGQTVEPRVLHALEHLVHTPPLARFLAEITSARCPVYRGFDFGAGARLPYLPQVRYRRTILAAARWLLRAGDLPGRAASMAQWEEGLVAWRALWNAPERVVLVEDDRRLPLDLGHPVHRLLLRTRLDRAVRLELRQAPAADDLAWLGRAHEILLHVRLRQSAGPSAPTATAVGDTESRGLPGCSAVLVVQIHAHPARFEEILTGHVPALMSAIGTEPVWWFRRHREMTRPEADQYLVLHVALPDGAGYGACAAAVGAWTDGLARVGLVSRLVLDTYRPQTGRFGHRAAATAAQHAFAADTAASLAQIRASGGDSALAQALAAASMLDVAQCFAPTGQQGLDWLIRHLPRGRGPLDPALRDRAFALTDPNPAMSGSLPGVLDAWRARASVLAEYRDALSGQRDPLDVLRSLLHLHVVRALGVDPDAERVTERLVRACALRRTHDRREG